jgi:hypothetical protein
MSATRLRLAPAEKEISETMFPPRAPFLSRTWGTFRFPTPLHAHSLEASQ